VVELRSGDEGVDKVGERGSRAEEFANCTSAFVGRPGSAYFRILNVLLYISGVIEVRCSLLRM